MRVSVGTSGVGGATTLLVLAARRNTEQLTFMCFLFAFIVIGNSSVLVAIVLSKNRKSRMNFFIMQLAIADLATGLITVLTDILWKSTIEWHAGNVGCKLVRYMQCVTTMSSTYVLVAMSIDRLDAIARPMNFAGSGKRARLLVCMAWGLAATFSVPMLFINKEMLVREDKQCWIDFPEPWHWKMYVTVLALLLFIIPAIMIAICYMVIVIIIWSKGSMDATPPPITRRFISNSILQRRENGHPKVNTSASSSRGLIPKARIKTIKMTLVIVLVFIICWSPFFVFDLLDVYGHLPMSQRKVAVAVFIQSLAPLNSAANPIIYCVFSSKNSWRRFPLCQCLQGTCCCPVSAVNRRHYSTSYNHSYISEEDLGRRCRRATANNRRHSSTPFVKTRLNEKENEILLKHVTRNGRHYVESVDDTTEENISAV